jgi:uncharacterized beta-barrel protein YwiB (DUF1934 family)
MKISEMIHALNESKEMYGDIDIEILIQTKDGLSDMDADGSEIYFSYEQYDDGDKLGIQNFPY